MARVKRFPGFLAVASVAGRGRATACKNERPRKAGQRPGHGPRRLYPALILGFAARGGRRGRPPDLWGGPLGCSGDSLSSPTRRLYWWYGAYYIVFLGGMI